jgi:hypothetical protein
MHQIACSNDAVTIESWRDIWIGQVRKNLAYVGGSFADKSIGQIYDKFKTKPMIVAGSGPSLKKNAHLFKNRGPDIGLISCLHNFHFLEECNANVDYYVSLDAGEVVLEEVSEGGTKTPEEYWAMTANRTLLAFIGSPPELLKKWQGPIYFFNCAVPDQAYEDLTNEIKFRTFVGSGGNVAGACMYIAKAYLGAGAIIYTGMDLSFGYDYKFHSWDSKYDKTLGHTVRAYDVYGVSVKTWQSYLNFKSWFDKIALTVPGIWINCTEGGIMGAYPNGIISCLKTMDLSDCLDMYLMNHHIREQATTPETENRVMLF